MNKNDEPHTSDEDFDDFFLKPIKSKNNITSKKKSNNTKNEHGKIIVSEIEMNEIKFENNKKYEEKIDLINQRTENKDIKKKESINDNKKLKPELNIEYSYIKINKSNIFSSISKDDNNYIDEIISSFKESKGKKIL